ncbi:MAG: phosphopantothenoylcysteine decarboxylase [Gemmataceae bacterium]
MNVLVTAGNTLALIDKVRCLTNVFTGRTGSSLAAEARARGHAVTLLTSRPEPDAVNYRTFEDLRDRMAEHVPKADAVLHCAAVSDYLAAGTYSPGAGNAFDPVQCWWAGSAMIDRSAGKIKSDEPELWLRLVRAPKLVDLVREPWGFKGVLVKFKLEVGVSDDELLAVAERSRMHSRADLMVANTLEGASSVAFLGPLAGRYERVARPELARRLLEEVERRG